MIASGPRGGGSAHRALVAVGQPYHLLARNSAHRWWIPLASVLLAAAFGFLFLMAALGLLWGFALLPRGLPRLDALGGDEAVVRSVLNDPMFQLWSGFAALVAMVPAVAVVARVVQHRPFGSVTGVAGAVRWRWLGKCGLVAAAVFVPAFAVEAAYEHATGAPGSGGQFPGWAVYGRIALLGVLVVPLQSAAEEYVFRGFLYQTLTAWFRVPWIAMAVSSVLFLLGHGYTDPLVWVQLLLMAGCACWLASRTGGLEGGIAMHTANNVIGLLLEATSGVPDMQQAGSFAVMSVLPFLAAIPTYTWIIDRLALRARLDTVIGGRASVRPLALRPRDDLRVTGTR